MALLVVDANRVLSALLRDGATPKVFLGTRAVLCAPIHLRDEVERNLELLAERTAVTPEAMRTVLTRLLGRLRWIEPHEYEADLPPATEALGRIDPDDVPYLACALAIGADGIWSHDKDFDAQDLVPRVAHPDAPARRRT